MAVCYKQDALPFGSGIVEMERGGYGETQAFPWQMDTAIARNSWCYTQDLAYKTSKELLQNLVDVVAKNGNLLLNIGPKADGTIPEQDQDILTELGELAGGKWRSHLSESALAGVIGRTDRGPGRFLLRWSKRHSIPAKISAIPCVMAFFMLSSWNQVVGRKS